MKSILVTGGAGFIGSHTALLLLERGYKLLIIDSFINSTPKSLSNIEKIILKKGFLLKERLEVFHGDLRDEEFVEKVFSSQLRNNNPIDAVIHFAGLKSVSQSILNPIEYWDFNLKISINILKNMNKFNCFNIIFSSSASIYRSIDNSLLKENNEICPINPYGRTKSTIERMLKDVFESSKKKWRIANLRYFNPIGAHPSGLIGEDPNVFPNNIFPLINLVAIGKIKNINIFGNDWPTKDGTGVRDYIHVMDLAEGHLLVMEYLLKNKPQILNLNLGTGKGTSVLELINVFQDVNNIEIPYLFVKRRAGDYGFVVADNSKLKNLLKWEPKRSIAEMCKDGWNWQKENSDGFI